eukprot:1019145-Pyramimonas_sp.AAC.1
MMWQAWPLALGPGRELDTPPARVPIKPIKRPPHVPHVNSAFSLQPSATRGSNFLTLSAFY